MKRSLLAVFVLVAGCSAGAPATPSPAPTLSPTVAPTQAPAATPTPTVPPTAAATATPGQTAGYSCDPDMNYGCDTPGPTSAANGDSVSLSPSGNYLVGANGMTLYVFDRDSAGQSACTSSDCVSAWPALTVDGGASPTAGDGVTGTLTTFDRGGGVMQVQYNDHPLYFFVGDSAPGDTSGDGVNGIWHLATP